MSRATGNIGEELARQYVIKQWYHIIETNFTIRWWEIDIIAKKDATWRFIEVKYRKSSTFWDARDALTSKKIHTLKRTIDIYCAQQQIDPDTIQIDFLAIQKEGHTLTYDLFENIEL